MVAKLQLRGLTAQQIGLMTKYQAFAAICEMDEEWKTQARIAGIDIKDEEEDQIATLQDLMAFGL